MLKDGKLILIKLVYYDMSPNWLVFSGGGAKLST